MWRPASLETRRWRLFYFGLGDWMGFLDGHQEVVHAAFGDPVIDGCFEGSRHGTNRPAWCISSDTTTDGSMRDGL